MKYLVVTEDDQIYQTNASIEDLKLGVFYGVINVVRFSNNKYQYFDEYKDEWVTIPTDKELEIST